MANHLLLFGRPLIMDEQMAALQVVGELPDYEAGDPFEGRLDILNGIGRCTVEVVEANLPPGYSVRVDNVLKKVVIKWPGYKTTTTADGVTDGDFAAGNADLWNLGSGWRIATSGVPGGGNAAVFENYTGISSISSDPFPYSKQSITANAKFCQGQSTKGQLSGRILLIWCDENGRMLPGGEGKSYSGGTLHNGGPPTEWLDSEVTAASHDAKTVRIGFSCNRTRRNFPGWVDNFTWNHTYTVGVGDDNTDFFLRIKVTDSANRVAYWYGAIWAKSLWFSSPIFPQYVDADSITNNIVFLEASTKIAAFVHDLPPEDFLTNNIVFVSADSRVVLRSTDMDTDALTNNIVFIGATLA